MTDTTDDIAEGISFQAFEDDCRLLGSLLHDVLLRELGPRFIHLLERNRILAQSKSVTVPFISPKASDFAAIGDLELKVLQIVEFCGGPMCWSTRTISTSSGGGAYCNGQKIHVSLTDKVEQSLLVTGFGYEHDDAWLTNINLFKEFTDISRGVRRLGSAAADMSHVGLGIAEGYWEYRLKPWDMAADVLIVEEAGGVVSRMDGGEFTVFDPDLEHWSG